MPLLTPRVWLTETILPLCIQSINKRVTLKGQPTTSCLFLTADEDADHYFFLAPKLHKPTHRFISSLISLSPCVSGTTVMLLYFFLPNELLSSICEGLSRFGAAGTRCKLFPLIVKSRNSVIAAGKEPVGIKDKFEQGKTHTSRKLGRIGEKDTRLFW